MDTLKEKKLFDEMYARGETPWTVWDYVDYQGQTATQNPLLLSNKGYVPNANGFHPKVSSYAQTGD